MIDRPLRSIAVVELKRQVERLEFLLDQPKGLCCLPCEKTLGGMISIDRPSHEVVSGVVAYIEGNPRDEHADIHETLRYPGGGSLRRERKA
jgi:hypothetical protein